MLETEHATRGAQRAFVRYEDLMDDWVPRDPPRRHRDRRCRASAAIDARAAEVDAFVDPTLHRNRIGWDDLDVPASACATWRRSVWAQLSRCRRAATGRRHSTLDARGAYARALRRGRGDRPVLDHRPRGRSAARRLPPRRSRRRAARARRPPHPRAVPAAPAPARRRKSPMPRHQRRHPGLQRRGLPRAVPGLRRWRRRSATTRS